MRTLGHHKLETLSDFLVNPLSCRAPKRLKLGIIPFFATKSVVKSCSKRKKLLEVAPNAKGCSKVAEHNRGMSNRASPLTSKIG